MTKYAPLTAHLAALGIDEWQASFEDMERLLGFQLPSTARRHRAWWSNNGSNNVMTRAWLQAGWRTEQVDMDGERLVFRRSNRTRPSRSDQQEPDALPSIVGAMRGTVRFHGDEKATGERWKAEDREL